MPFEELSKIFKKLEDDERIPEEKNLTENGNWSELMLTPQRVKQEQEEFLELAERFKRSLNKVILPIRLGVYALYSTKKINIFNSAIVDVLEKYSKKVLYQQQGFADVLKKGVKSDLYDIEYQLYFWDYLAKSPKLHASQNNQNAIL